MATTYDPGTLSTSITTTNMAGITQDQVDRHISEVRATSGLTKFDLNQMASLVVTPANAYAEALENLRGVSSTGEMGIATLTQSTTEVQVQQGKLEMINGIIKNAVNYLNNRARSLTQ